jgi:hypothetical protein
MDPPKTRRESKKDPKQKGKQVFSQKHVRQVELLKEKKSK